MKKAKVLFVTIVIFQHNDENYFCHSKISKKNKKQNMRPKHWGRKGGKGNKNVI